MHEFLNGPNFNMQRKTPIKNTDLNNLIALGVNHGQMMGVATPSIVIQ